MRPTRPQEVEAALNGTVDSLRVALSPGTRMRGHVALVTGAGSRQGPFGVGAATAALLALQGASVAVVDVDGDCATRTCELIEALGGVAAPYTADVRDEVALTAAVTACTQRFGTLDVAVNNAAITSSSVTRDIAGWRTVIDVNLIGTQLVTDIVTREFRNSGVAGSIVNVSSIAAMRGMGTGAYAASKGGIIALTLDGAVEHGPAGIRVNCVVPGHPIGPMSPTDPTARRRRTDVSALGIEGTSVDVAWAILFLASDDARWISGAVLPVDGGAAALAPLLVAGRLAPSD